MATNELVKRLGPTEADLDALLNDALNGVDDEALATKYEDTIKDFKPDKIVKGRVLNIVGDDVVVDVGYKSEGIVPLEHWRDRNEVDIGDTVEVLLESIEDDMGLIQLSKRRADRIRGWERVISTYKKGDVVKGRVTRKIKGGLLVDIGVPVFLPASQIDIRRVPDVGEWLNNEIEAKIIKIDEARMNIVVSRRKLLEEQREEMKKELFERLTEGDVVEGQVKNLADFGAFVDLGGIDGLLHITDLSWGRVGHPSEVVQVGQMVRVKVLKIDRVSERISLGLKQLSDSPWKSVLDRYPVSSRHTGKVVSLVSYGAFVKLEDGVEGLVHVSEMSWTKRVNHPSDVVTVGDEVEVMILDINREKQEISLGMKQTGPDPWTHVESNYPPGTEISGVVRNMTNYGAFIEIEEGVDGLLHVTDISWTKKIMHPSEVLKKGEALKAVVLSVDQEKKRVALGLKQLGEDPWETLIPEQFQVGMSVEGKVTKIANFGVFVELDDNLEGLLHVSELAEHKIDNPAEVVIPGQGLEVKIIKVDSEERKIGLSLKRMLEVDEATAAAAKAQAEAAAAEADGTEAKEKAEAPAAEETAEAPAAEEKAEAPAAEEKAEAPAAEEKAEAPAAEEKAEAPAAEEKAEAPAAEEKADAPAAGSSDGDATESAS